ncbi:PAS domain S-box protein [Methylobacterium nonmethylotrophicum]|nr:PAS domain S-box protein [Methylobacterium nonmethylotrophicum]
MIAYLAAILIVCLGGWQLLRGREAALVDARGDVRNLARSLAQHATRSAEAVDIVLSGIVDRVEHGALRDPNQFRTFLEKRVKAVTQVRNLAVLDERGDWIIDSVPGAHPPLNSADRDYFLWHRERPDPGMHLGEMILSRATGKWLIPLTRRWNKPDGSFGGLVAAALDPAYFQSFYDELGVGQQGSIALISDRARLLVRHPYDPGMVNLDVSRGPLFRDLLPRSPVGTASSVQALDGNELIVAYERLRDFPFVVWVGRSVPETLAAWRREVLVVGGVIASAAVLLALLGLHLDRRQRRVHAAEALIRESEARYRLLADNASDVIMIKDVRRGGLRSYVSPAIRAVLGYDPEEFAALPPRDLIHPDDAGRVLALEAGIDADHPVATSVHRLRHKDGRWLWVEVAFTWMRQDDGEPRLLGTIRDVSERVAAEEAIRASQRDYRLLAETTTDVITRLDLEFRRTYVSPACRTVLGYEPEELLGCQPSAAIHPDDAPAVREAAGRLTGGQVPQGRIVTTYRTRHKAGHWIWIEAGMSLARDAEDQPAAIVCSLRDVTARRQAEAALARLREEAEAARAEAEKASLAKSEFLAAMSHEIRTPLHGVIGYADLLVRDGGLAPVQRRQAQCIQTAGKTLLTIVNDVLDFAKIEAGQIDLDPQPFAMRAMLEDAVSILREPADRKGVTLHVEIDPALPPHLIGDQDRVRQIVLNLLSNAIKFTARGTVTLRLRCDPVDDPTAPCRFLVAVADTGIGIPREHLGRLFQRFAQADASVQRRFGGTGLGLAISKTLVERMGGEIGVESEAGAGSTFWFRLALMPATAPAAGTVAEVAAAARSGRPARILLAEDGEINQDIARVVLESAGHAVTIVSDGVAAIEAVKGSDFDLVLMDVQMAPGMDGLTATRHIRSLDHPARDLPIVAMTANVLPAQLAECRLAGMNDHVGKPFHLDELLGAVARWTSADDRPAAPSLQAEPPAAVFDPQTFDALAQILGQDRMRRILSGLAEELRARFPVDSPRERLVREAHATVSAAGALGFPALTRACREIEETCGAEGDLGPLIRRVGEARDAALEEIRRLQTAA